MSGSHHVGCMLPGERHVYADFRDPVVPAIRRWNRLVVTEHKPPRPKDVAVLEAWFEAHADEAKKCLAGECDHYV